MEESLTYSDVLIKPQFSLIRSRAEVSLDFDFLGMLLSLPIISSNMDSVTSPELAAAMSFGGAASALHRFQTIDENVNQFYKAIELATNSIHTSKYTHKPIGSFGVGKLEYERAIALVDAGCNTLLLDVAHGAAIHVVEQYDRLRSRVSDNVSIIVGNFDNSESIKAFIYHSKSNKKPDALKVGIGNGSACITRVVTGVGGGMISTLLDCSQMNIPLIADGGAKNSGDIAKALAAGADMVMMGSLFAGTTEAPGELVDERGRTERDVNFYIKTMGQLVPSPYAVFAPPFFKRYRGSASIESYAIQDKIADHRTPEGESMLIPHIGSVESVLSKISAGLRSTLSYTGSNTINEFKEKAELRKVSPETHYESQAHAKDR